MSTQIFNVDFHTKKVLDKYIGSAKVEYYKCLQCQKKCSHTKSDVMFVPSINWSVEQNKRTVNYSLCKYCVEHMYNLLNGGER